VVATKLTAETLSLSPVVVIVALFFWSFILGTMGMFLGMPLTVIMVMIMSHFNETRWLATLMTRRPEDKLISPAAEKPADKPAAA
jgi:predicted PurR-regulated permease PerM